MNSELEASPALSPTHLQDVASDLPFHRVQLRPQSPKSQAVHCNPVEKPALRDHRKHVTSIPILKRQAITATETDPRAILSFVNGLSSSATAAAFHLVGSGCLHCLTVPLS